MTNFEFNRSGLLQLQNAFELSVIFKEAAATHSSFVKHAVMEKARHERAPGISSELHFQKQRRQERVSWSTATEEQLLGEVCVSLSNHLL